MSTAPPFLRGRSPRGPKTLPSCFDDAEIYNIDPAQSPEKPSIGLRAVPLGKGIGDSRSERPFLSWKKNRIKEELVRRAGREQ